MTSATLLNKVILIQPAMGFSGEYCRHIPLSLLYVAAGLRTLPLEIVIVDVRLHADSWRERLQAQLTPNTLLVGITVMSGAPVRNAIDLSGFVRAHSRVPVVWGGSLPTVAPHAVLDHPDVTYTVSGSGVSAIHGLVSHLLGRDDAPALEAIPGLGFRKNGTLQFNLPFQGFEPLSHHELPYRLISDPDAYGQIGTRGRVFPLYAAHGCPYQCAFCISPALYKSFPRRWEPITPVQTLDHLEYLVRELGAEEIYLYDDDSFVNLDHIRALLEGIRARGLHLRLSFRGARINEILKMDDDFLRLLAESGTTRLHIGIESGSPRVLTLYQKGITVQDILAANRQLARVAGITAGYNWIVGTPGETVAEIHQTIDLLWRLIRENPRCFIFAPNKFHPIPGTPLADLAVHFGYVPPRTLHDWAAEENEGDKDEPWYTSELSRLIRMLQVTSYFIDGKGDFFLAGTDARSRLLRGLMGLYKPFARLRFTRKISAGLFEFPIFQWALRRLQPR
jgi:radical SAM superfamily enzyme YgiQ (UPF0313 family)